MNATHTDKAILIAARLAEINVTYLVALLNALGF
jgi:hypothetical protein